MLVEFDELPVKECPQVRLVEIRRLPRVFDQYECRKLMGAQHKYLLTFDGQRLRFANAVYRYLI
ncbi:MAG TPA: hypothetical protein VGL08_16845 [Paraburkholderia sp.]|jgi:hypothetical protein